MKYTLILYLTFAISQIACFQAHPEDIKGNWTLQYITEPELIIFDQIQINSNNIVTLDEMSFPEMWTYKIRNNIIEFRNSQSQTLNLTIDKILNDSFWIEGNKYVKEEMNRIDSYNLPNIETGQFLKIDNNSRIIHLYKNGHDKEVQIRCGDKVINPNIEIIFEYLSNHSSYVLKKPRIILFIGDSISVNELLEVYYLLWYNGVRRVELVLNKIDVDEYEVLNDRIDLWHDDVNKYFKEKNYRLPPPLLFDSSTRQDLLDLGVPNIKIDKLEDLEKINAKFGGKTVLASINNNLSLNDYVKIKLGFLSLKKRLGIRAWTEFMPIK